MLYHSEHGPAQDAYTTVVVPLDGSELAERVLPDGVEMAVALRLKMVLVRAVSLPVLAQAWDAGSVVSYPADLLGELEQDAQQYLDATAAGMKKRGFASCSTKVLRGVAGSIGSLLVDFVTSEPQAIVAMSSHGRSGIGRWVLGSIAEQIVHGTQAPTLIVR